MPDPLATLTDRLYPDYQPGLTHADIDRVLQRCRADLAGTPDTALPELLERLARQRLSDQFAAHRTSRDPARAAVAERIGPRAADGPDHLHRRLTRQKTAQ
jgi:hypothetical protein